MRARASAAREGPEVEIRVNPGFPRPVGEVIEVGGRARWDAPSFLVFSFRLLT